MMKEISNKSIYCENGKIIDIGDLENFNYNPGLIIDAHESCYTWFVNTHHHLFQNLTRCYPGSQNESLFDGLQIYILFGVKYYP